MEKKKRLSKALAAAGIASRRAAEEIIFEGRVKVNGTCRQSAADPGRLGFRYASLVDEEPIKGEEKKFTTF